MSARVTLRYGRAPSALAYMLRGAVPAARRFDTRPAIGARWTGHRVDRRSLTAYLRITGQESTDTLPLLYPHTFGFRLSMAILTHPAFPVPIWGVLQTRNHVLLHQPIPVGASLDFAARASAGRVLDKGAEIDLHTTVHVEGALAWESLVTFYVRGRFGAPEPASPLARAPADFGAEAARWTMPDEGHWRFGSFTGDYNGIHAWDWYARRFGFRRALYHPPRVLAHCLARLDGVPRQEPQRLDAWLKGPVSHGAAVRMHARGRAGEVVFALYEEDDRPRIVGRLARVAPGSRLVADTGAPIFPSNGGNQEDASWSRSTSTV